MRAGQAWWRRWAELGPLGRRSRQVLLLSALTGLLTGLAVAAFEFVVSEQLLAQVESWPLPLQAATPLAGLVLAAAALRWLANGASPETSDNYIRNFHDRHHRLDRRPVPGRVAAAVATLGLGGAMGYEGPSIYLGAAIGAAIQSRLTRYFSREEAKTLMVAGAAAGLAAIFKAPATGAVFAIEVPYQDDIAGHMVLPALCASAVGYATFAALRSTAPLLPITGSIPFHLIDLAQAVVVGIACGAGARLFAWGLRAGKRTADRRANSLAIRVAGAAVALAALAYASKAVAGTAFTLGPGYRAISWATDPRQGLAAVAVILVLRAAATLATVEGGGVGGLFIPLVVEGALLGRLLGGAFGGASTLYPMLGVAAFLGAGYRTPLAAVTFVAETTGRAGFVVPGLIAAVVSQLVMGNRSVAPDQLPTRSGYLETRLRLPVSAAMSTDAPTVAPTTTAEAFVREHFVAQHLFVAPVVDGAGQLAGVVDLADIEGVPREQWATTTIAGLMHAANPGRTDWSLRAAVAAMESADVDVLPIVNAQGRYVGLLTMEVVLALTDLLGTNDDYGKPPSAQV